MTRRKNPRTGLTQQQELFCLAFIQCGIGSEAYKKAYPRSLKWRRSSLDAQASKMMDNPLIDVRISELRAAIEKEVVLDEAVFLREAAALATSRITDIYTPSGNILPVHKWPDRVLAAVSSIKFTGMREGTASGNGGLGDDVDEDPQDTVVMFTQEVKFWDKNSALDKIFKHKGTYERDNRQKGESVGDMLAKLSPEDLGMVVDKLREIAARNPEPGLDGQTDTGSGQHTTH